MRITKHITFFNSPKLRYRYNHLNRIIKEVCSYPYETDIYIHTNENILNHYLTKNTNGKLQVIVHDFTNGNPLYLTWSCRHYLKEQKDDYDIFIYIEDDMLIPVSAIKYWLEHKDELINYNFNLGFIRIETDVNGNEYMVDIIRKLNTNNTVVINGKNYVINNVNTFVASWIYDKKEFKVFLNSPYYNGNGNITNYDIQAASGIGYHGVGMNRYKNTIIPFDENKKLHDGCKVYHLDNVYLYKHDECSSSTILFKDALI
jgi:hypothetical protein